LERAGYKTQIQHPENLAEIKSDLHVPYEMQSCHTAVSENGYIFEGHIPARYIKQFLASPPADAIGLAVPAMPIGSPGMEIENSFTPYSVMLLKNDGTKSIYVSVTESLEN
jgi:hypothetical protein